MVINEHRNSKNKLYTKIRFLRKNMIERCYNERNPSYKNYGGKGVTVSEEWLTLNGFIETIDLVKGWNLESFLLGDISLDKDSMKKGNKVYSKELCCFLSTTENNKIKPNQQSEIIGISPSGEIFKFTNQSEFAKEHSLRQSTISNCIQGRVKKHKGWKFYKK